MNPLHKYFHDPFYLHHQQRGVGASVYGFLYARTEIWIMGWLRVESVVRHAVIEIERSLINKM